MIFFASDRGNKNLQSGLTYGIPFKIGHAVAIEFFILEINNVQGDNK